MFTIATLSLLSGLVACILTLIVLQGARRLYERVTFTLFAGGMSAWAVFVSLFSLTEDTTLAAVYVPLYYSFAVVLIYGLLAFSMSYARHRSNRATPNTVLLTRRLWLLALPVIAMIAVTLMPGGLIQSVDVSPGKHLVELHQGLYFIYCLLFIVYACLAIYYLTRTLNDKNKLHRQNYLIVLVISICLPVASFFNLILPLIDIYSFITVGPIFVLPVAVIFFHAIIRHSLFDIRLAAVRSMAYSLILGTMVGVYFGLAYIASTVLQMRVLTSAQLFVSIAIAVLLALAFQPIKQFFDRLTNRLFYKYNYNSDEFYARLNQKLSSSSGLRDLLERASEEIGRTMQAEQSFFYVRYGERSHMSAGSRQHSKLLSAEMSILDVHTREMGDAIIVTAMLPENSAVYTLLERKKIAIAMPMVANGDILGYAFLGARRSGNYTSNDIRVLETSADTLLIAVQNALSAEEIRELNATLQQRVDDATKELRASNAQLQKLDEAKDEFVSMASHQLRTPLTSVKGYISMVLEGDAGKISDAQKHLLGEAFTSSERMVHLINDFLNVSRLQTGKFMVDRRPIDLAKITHQEVDSLKTTADARELKLKFRKPAYFPTLYIDEGKIRQVIMNFIDNAIYYSSEYSTITIQLSVVDGSAVLTVHNEGIGVPESEQAHLFTKFFRATNARKQRPDGTGVGLYLAKKVITAHGGDMVFESVKDEGTTFGFRLPIKKLSAAPPDDTN